MYLLDAFEAFILPPRPRSTASHVPESLKSKTAELSAISFTSRHTEAPMTIALQVALDIGSNQICTAGFDGYPQTLSEIEYTLMAENQNIIGDFIEKTKLPFFAITKTAYRQIAKRSLYSMIS